MPQTGSLEVLLQLTRRGKLQLHHFEVQQIGQFPFPRLLASASNWPGCLLVSRVLSRAEAPICAELPYIADVKA